MKPILASFAMVCAITALPVAAAAQDQPWLRDRRYTEGPGYRVGDFELHPGAAAEFGYDSNYYRAEPERNPVGSLRLRITPSFSISTLTRQRREATPNASPPDVEFRGGVAVTYNEFFPVSGAPAERNNLRDQRNVGGILDLNLLIMPQRPWSGTLNASVARQITGSDQGISGASFNRDVPTAGGELIWTPGAGLLDWRLGYLFSGTVFESTEFAALTNVQNQVYTRGRWRFLPRTALLADMRAGFVTYTNPKDKTASHPLRAQLGLSGLITQSFALTVMAGWGASFYTPKPQEDFDSVIGQLELKWFLSPSAKVEPGMMSPSLSAIAIGFSRDFYDSYIGTFFERDKGYVNFSYNFDGRFLIVVDGNVGPVIYPEITGTVAHAPWTDVRIESSLFGEYRFKDQFGVNLTLRYNQNISSTSIITTTGAGAPAADSLAYKEFESYLGFRWMM